MMRLKLVTCGVLLVAFNAIAIAGQKGDGTTENFSLSLRREYGRAAYRECRLHVGVFDAGGRTALWCHFNIEPPKYLRAERALTREEIAVLSTLARASDLCVGGHTGRDGRAVDGVLETLLTTCQDGLVAILVTSGNPTFSTSDARRQLLDYLRALEEQLRKSAPPPK